MAGPRLSIPDSEKPIGFPDGGTPDFGPARNEHADQARSTLSDADRLAYLLDLDSDELFRNAHEQPLLDTFRALVQAQAVARRLHELAQEFDVARSALRERLAYAVQQHDAQSDELAGMESPRLAYASSSGTAGSSARAR